MPKVRTLILEKTNDRNCEDRGSAGSQSKDVSVDPKQVPHQLIYATTQSYAARLESLF
jgi:hypothetical protein